MSVETGRGPSRPLFLLAGLMVSVIGLFSMGCAFTNRIIDRSIFDKPEMAFDSILPDRDLPDVAMTLASEWGSGAGGGAVGGCWTCG